MLIKAKQHDVFLYVNCKYFTVVGSGCLTWMDVLWEWCKIVILRLIVPEIAMIKKQVFIHMIDRPLEFLSSDNNHRIDYDLLMQKSLRFSYLKSCIVSYYRQYSTNIKIQIIKLIPVLLAWAFGPRVYQNWF